MSFSTFNASLPYFESLHDQAKLKKEIASLSESLNLDGLKLTSPKDAKVKHPFMDALQEEANKMRTVNNAVTHKSTNDACLDLFYELGMSVHTPHVFTLLDNAWREDPMMTLHIIWHSRSIHRGKSSKVRFYVAFCWLLKNHPQTALQNMSLLVADVVSVNEKNNAKKAVDDWDMLEDEYRERLKSHGYWKDLLNVCKIYADGELDGPTDAADGAFRALNCPRQERRPWEGYEDHRHLSHQFYESIKDLPQEEQLAKRAERNAATTAKHQAQIKAQAEEKRTKRATRHSRIVDLLTNDPLYRAMHFTAARLFADQLRLDLELLRNNHTDKKFVPGLSLAGKWAPTLGRSHDKSTLLATSISELLFPPAQYQDAEETREHYLNKVRELYRKQVTTPLRSALDITEIKMSQNEWGKINYSHVPSKCMKLNTPHFFIHDQDRYLEYIQSVTSGKATITGATLQPHELVQRIRSPMTTMRFPKSLEDNQKLTAKLSKCIQAVCNAQWKTLVESIRNDAKGGNLGSALAVCDMSSSMENPCCPIVPQWAAIGLSLLLAEFAAPPFNGAVITFADNPAVVQVGKHDTLSDKVTAMFESEVGYSTDFNSVFLKLLLPMALKHELKPEDMVKRLFVFSDMEFNEGYGEERWETNYETIKKAYEKHGYKVPELVWWNLAAVRPGYGLNPETPKPVTKEVEGCAMITGYSGSMFKTFLEQEQIEDKVEEVAVKGNMGEENSEKSKPKDQGSEDELDPVSLMKSAIEHESFAKLVVVD